MKLEKAIKIGERWYAGGFATQIDDMNPAIKLLIEAGKRVKWHKEQHEPGFYEPLPGETPETDTKRSFHHIKEVLESPLGREPGV